MPALLLAARGLVAQVATTTAVGGTGGDPYTISCGTKAMVGIKSRFAFHVFSNFVDKIQPVCVSVDADGGWIGSPSPTSSFAGVANSENSTAVSVTCPSHAAISGFSAQSGIYVDNFWIDCRQMGVGGLQFGASDLQQPSLGSFADGMTPSATFSCPNNKPANGVTGKAHDWIDRLALTCDQPAVPPPSVSTLDASPKTVVGGNPVNGSFSLNVPALMGGTSVGFSVQMLEADVAKVPAHPISPNPAVVTAGGTHGTFVFSTVPVATPVDVSINVGSPTAMHTARFTIVPPSLASLSLSPGRVAPGNNSTGSVSLTGTASTGGVSVTLTSSVPAAATVPATIVVPQGQPSTTFPVSIASNKAACTVVTASGVFVPAGGAAQRQTTLAISPVVNKAFVFAAPASGVGTLMGTLSLAATTKEVRSYTLVSSNPAILGIPSSVAISAGATSANVPIAIQGSPPVGTNCAAVIGTDREGNANAVIFEIVGTSMRRIG